MRNLNFIRPKPKGAWACGDGMWYIAKKHNEQVFYVHDYDTSNGAVKWSHSRGKAMKFHTQAGAYQFHQTQLKDRRDVYFIYIEGN